MIGQWDLVSYPGLIAAVVALIGVTKKLWKPWVKGKEPMLAVALSYVLGISSKLTIPKAFQGIYWVPFLVTLVFVAMAAMSAHDRIVNQVLAGKPAPDSSKRTP